MVGTFILEILQCVTNASTLPEVAFSILFSTASIYGNSPNDHPGRVYLSAVGLERLNLIDIGSEGFKAGEGRSLDVAECAPKTTADTTTSVLR